MKTPRYTVERDGETLIAHHNRYTIQRMAQDEDIAAPYIIRDLKTDEIIRDVKVPRPCLTCGRDRNTSRSICCTLDAPMGVLHIEGDRVWTFGARVCDECCEPGTDNDPVAEWTDGMYGPTVFAHYDCRRATFLLA